MVILASACIPSGADDEPDEAIPVVPSGTVAIPPERLTPFCQAMIDLSETLETDPPDDIDALIVETYTDIVDDVPVEISNVFNAVLANLLDNPVPTTTGSSTTTPAATSGDGSAPESSLSREGDDFFAEGYLPGDDPAERLNAYVDFECRDIQNNPGPPATQPLGDIAPATNSS